MWTITFRLPVLPSGHAEVDRYSGLPELATSGTPNVFRLILDKRRVCTFRFRKVRFEVHYSSLLTARCPPVREIYKFDTQSFPSSVRPDTLDKNSRMGIGRL